MLQYIVHGLLVITTLCFGSGCTFLDIRPQNLRGSVSCQPSAGSPSQPLTVRVVLDEAAIRQHSRFEIIREVSHTTPNATSALLAVDVGSAMGAIDGCGTFEERTIEIYITDQMLSYPSWIRIRSRSHDHVALLIVDQTHQPVVDPLLLSPTPARFDAQWTR